MKIDGNALPYARQFRVTPIAGRKPLLSESLRLTPTAADAFRHSPRSVIPRRTFGGATLGQAIHAAGLTMPADRAITSIHSHFIAAGNAALPADYSVERLRDGRSFSTRQVRATQGDKPIFLLTASSQAEEGGLREQPPAPLVPSPEELPDPETLFADDPANREWIRSLISRNPIECRFVERPPRADGVRGVAVTPHQRVWIRITDSLPDEDLIDRAALGYISDLFLLATGVAAHGRTLQDIDLQFATLDHTIWFHTRPPMNEWLLYDQHGLWSGGGRALCHGSFFTRDGSLVATVTQQALIRVRPDGTPSADAGEPLSA